jgi:hypothetical protein
LERLQHGGGIAGASRETTVVEMDALHLPRNACDKMITLKEIA